MRTFYILLLLLVVGALTVLALPLMSKQRLIVSFDGIVGDPARGEYVLRMSGCLACHTDSEHEGKLMAGGVEIDTAFGKFYSPNITSDKRAGIGDWSLQEFYVALTAGLSPKGEHYYPSFPYTSYTKMNLSDIADLKAYLDTVPPVANRTQRHALEWPFSMRHMLGIWKWLNFKLDRQTTLAKASDDKDRGAYLVNGPGHCAECHSQRNRLGGIDDRITLGGTSHGPDDQPVPAISGPDADIRSWEETDLIFYLQTGVLPDGDVVSGAMVEVINESTSFLSDQDLKAIAQYLLESN